MTPQEHTQKIETYQKGEICYRCGVTKKENRREKWVCNHWGTSFTRHLWNDEPLTVEIQEIKTKH